MPKELRNRGIYKDKICGRRYIGFLRGRGVIRCIDQYFAAKHYPPVVIGRQRDLFFS